MFPMQILFILHIEEYLHDKMGGCYISNRILHLWKSNSELLGMRSYPSLWPLLPKFLTEIYLFHNFLQKTQFLELLIFSIFFQDQYNCSNWFHEDALYT